MSEQSIYREIYDRENSWMWWPNSNNWDTDEALAVLPPYLPIYLGSAEVYIVAMGWYGCEIDLTEHGHDLMHKLFGRMVRDQHGD